METTTDRAPATESAQLPSDQQAAHVNADDQRILEAAQSIVDQASKSYMRYDSASNEWKIPSHNDYRNMSRAELLVLYAQLGCDITRLQGFRAFVRFRTKRINFMIRNGKFAKELADSHAKTMKPLTTTLDSTFETWLKHLYYEKSSIRIWVRINEIVIQRLSDGE
ncbi:MAG: hypothetical protein L6R37_007877 [Teloschistes peruensis]|nr:MAG: hypothetical protein L6R37_007877 [Teloschistes peruensis]